MATYIILSRISTEAVNKLILRTAGHETTETLVATPWEDMLRNLQESGRVAMAT